ncbi:MAG TPA: DUF389 domain-containing protein [Candidatus Obscuribacterales bacterium]
MPIIRHVPAEKLRDLQARLEDMSRLSVDFLVLLASSTAIATLGLFLNSAAVIIGAMIIAPLIRPLMGLALASLTADILLMRRAVGCLVAGTILGIAIAYGLAFLLQSLQLTAEILARTRPNLLDLGVAVAAGAVAAYCQIKQELSDTLAGVAIAVALVPPLSVVGIGLAHHATAVWAGAALLYATNLVGISVAGALVLFITGYTPIKQAGRGLAVSAAAIAILTVPLGLSMRELLIESNLKRRIAAVLAEKTSTFRRLKLQSVEVKRFQHPTAVVATVLGAADSVSPAQVKMVEDFLTRETGMPLRFRLQIIGSTEISGVEVSPSGQVPLVTPAPVVPLPVLDAGESAETVSKDNTEARQPGPDRPEPAAR